MITHTGILQGSLEWHMLRSGIPTASEFDALLTPEFKIKTGEGPKTYLAKKVAEVWQGGPLPSFQGFDMEQGQVLESEAIPWFELAYSTAVQRVAFCTTDDKRVGCSPDGLIGEDGGIEIKCPAAHTHVGYLLQGGTLPKEYAAQVHGSMYVTGRPRWQFVSYRRHFPALVLTIERDAVIQEQIAAALERFLEAFDEATASLEKINGGPPRRLTPMANSQSITPAPSSVRPYVLHQLEVTP